MHLGCDFIIYSINSQQWMLQKLFLHTVNEKRCNFYGCCHRRTLRNAFVWHWKKMKMVFMTTLCEFHYIFMSYNVHSLQRRRYAVSFDIDCLHHWGGSKWIYIYIYSEQWSQMSRFFAKGTHHSLWLWTKQRL